MRATPTPSAQRSTNHAHFSRVVPRHASHNTHPIAKDVEVCPLGKLERPKTSSIGKAHS